jgi:serine protease Do
MKSYIDLALHTRSPEMKLKSGDSKLRGVMATRRSTLLTVGAALLTACQPLAQRAAPDFVPVVRRAAPAVVGIADSTGVIGSGFRVQPSMLFVTAAHVVAHPKGALLVRWQGKNYAAMLLTSSEQPDLALLKLDDAVAIPALTLVPDRDAAAAGSWILVMGCPFGGGVTTTVGILSALPGAVLEPAVLRDRIQLNAAVNPGNSGGPVINLNGEVIGVANATIPGGYGLGFAIPASAVRAVLEKTGRER